MINIQSISDLITNSSTEVFVVYEESNIKSIKELVNAILSLNGIDKTFDDYFKIEMMVNYDSLGYALEDLYDEDNPNDEIPEAAKFNNIEWEEQEDYLRTIPDKRAVEIIEAANNKRWSRYRPYEGILITSKVDDPVVEKVASVINRIDSIFEIDYSSDS